MDWIQFLESNSIPYVTRGPNTKRGEVSIKCPYCGDEDPSEHLGISLSSENWGCHRNPQHRGHASHSLIAALLGCPTGQARLIAGQYSVADPDTLDAALAVLTGTTVPPRAIAGPIKPPPMRAISQTGPTAKFWRYLEQRGFDDVPAVTQKYNLSCCLTDRWKDRLIIPFYQDGYLIGWTGRALVTPINAPRYLSSGDAVKRTVFNEDELVAGGELLLLVEGPFDAIKIDYYGSKLGARATCVFGTSMSIDQIAILSNLRKRFSKTVILFDHDAIEPSFIAQNWLNVSIGTLPKGVKDPGEMTETEIIQFLTKLRKS